MSLFEKKIYNVKNEIDYDKLAKAISKELAQNAQPTTKEKPKNEKLGFWKSMWYIIRNKKQSNGCTTSGLIGGLLSIGFNSLAILGAVAFVFGLISMVVTAVELPWSKNTTLGFALAIIIWLAILVLVALLSIVFRASANEMKEEKDRNYIVTVFSGIVGFAALIVAVIALLKGVG